MQITPIQNQQKFKAYSSIDMYRLEQKIDQLRSQLDSNGDLNSFYKDLPKTRQMPMPLGVPPYVMAGMPAPSITPPRPLPGLPPVGMIGMYGMPPIGMPPIGTMGFPPIGTPPLGGAIGARLSGQPPFDTYSKPPRY